MAWRVCANPDAGTGLPVQVHDKGLPVLVQGTGLPVQVHDKGLPVLVHGTGLPALVHGKGLPVLVHGTGLPVLVHYLYWYIGSISARSAMTKYMSEPRVAADR